MPSSLRYCRSARGSADYRLRRSRRALRFLLPTFRRRRGLAIAGSFLASSASSACTSVGSQRVYSGRVPYRCTPASSTVDIVRPHKSASYPSAPGVPTSVGHEGPPLATPCPVNRARRFPPQRMHFKPWHVPCGVFRPGRTNLRSKEGAAWSSWIPVMFCSNRRIAVN
jgi:hypothetical protein